MSEDNDAIERMMAAIRQQRTSGADRQREALQMAAEIITPLIRAMSLAKSAVTTEKGLGQANIVLNEGERDQNKISYTVTFSTPNHHALWVTININAKSGHVDMHWEPTAGQPAKAGTFAKGETAKMRDTLLDICATYFGQAKG